MSTDKTDKEDKIIRFDLLKIDYAREKLCKCSPRKYTVDYKNKLVFCECGAIHDPFEVLYDIATWFEREVSQMRFEYSEAVKATQYKPYMKAMKNIQSEIRRGLLPYCPKCNELIKIENITSWGNARFYKERGD